MFTGQKLKLLALVFIILPWPCNAQLILQQEHKQSTNRYNLNKIPCSQDNTYIHTFFINQ
ncbi:hypothetical protein V6Z11_A01G249800 [Gossypium hirsutum]